MAVDALQRQTGHGAHVEDAMVDPLRILLSHWANWTMEDRAQET